MHYNQTRRRQLTYTNHQGFILMADKQLNVDIMWDKEALVWIATSDDVPGLATEHHSFDALVEKLKVMIPELLEANGQTLSEGTPIPFHIHSELDSIAIAV
jgi:predicted RNase H-like HicB family nuclease